MSKLSKWQSDFFKDLSEVATTAPDGRPRPGSMTTSSITFRILWWFHLVAPVIVFVTALSSGDARSADEALGSAFIYGDLFLLGAGLGVFVGLASVKSRHMNRREKTLGVALSLGIVPLVLLIFAADAVMGWRRGELSIAGVMGVAALHIVWIAFVLAIRSALTRARRAG
jgi:hypothetical protein